MGFPELTTGGEFLRRHLVGAVPTLLACYFAAFTVSNEGVFSLLDTSEGRFFLGVIIRRCVSQLSKQSPHVSSFMELLVASCLLQRTSSYLSTMQ